MLEKFYMNQSDNTDLNVYRCGIEECSPGYTWGPGVRDHYIIHYVISGKGSFYMNGKPYNLSEGTGFLIPPNTVVSYSADINDPWTYSWAGFHGLKAESILKKAGLASNSPIFTYRHDNRLHESLKSMISEAKMDSASELMLLGHLYIFLSLLVKNNREMNSVKARQNDQEKYIRKSIEFISKNYSMRLSVFDICKSIGLDRSYLYTLFIKYLDISPQNFIINYRLKKSIDLMKNPELSVGDIARSVGYTDPMQYSKIFKKIYGVCPSVYRNR